MTEQRPGTPSDQDEPGPDVPREPAGPASELPSAPPEAAPESKGQSNSLVIILALALIQGLTGIIFLLVAYVFGGQSGSEEESALPPPGQTVERTLILPTPEAGNPTATVTARKGVNVRTGPGLNFPVIGIAPLGSTLEIVGVSTDGTWWVVNVPAAPQGNSWVSEEFVEVENGQGVMVIPSPPGPTPVVTPTATPTPAPDITFTANRTTINAGQLSVFDIYGNRILEFVGGLLKQRLQPIDTPDYQV